MRNVLFLLPVGGGSGGAHSVMQEADAMWGLGVQAFVASNTANAAKLRHLYRELPRIRHSIVSYGNPKELGALLDKHAIDVAIATTNQSVHTLADALAARESTRSIRTAYYIQDYEPLFYEIKSDDWHAAYASYGRIPGMICFAKTRWLQEVVENNHGVAVSKVEPSVDHEIYYPDLGSRLADKAVLSIVAMLRPSTPRRAPRRTCRILNRLSAAYPGRVACSAFGAADDEIHAAGLRLIGVENHGMLDRRDVGQLFRSADLFLDLSDYQAFGRSAVEAMACGALSLVPAHGGAHEFAQDGENGFIVDTRSDAQILEAVAAFLSMTQAERVGAALAAIDTGFRYSPQKAALSELQLLLN